MKDVSLIAVGVVIAIAALMAVRWVRSKWTAWRASRPVNALVALEARLVAVEKAIILPGAETTAVVARNGVLNHTP